ncbi:hypothetical protein FA09DRAFT_101080 [Tilletiopsis washingtonensis]|uniref:Uncharacterized protein n=1 Tax=Tilletiopsis washingtonensis TaxID=58919 RepID=A0A316Z4U0_9BASI|nr:hypothetical protein FA09DRAFT_101080 [Tilletiopsis washingtonensis]PWN95952.1 hypothetical protein FA09DRAFT_101080 [Tilletiopsis washingtonensis]
MATRRRRSGASAAINAAAAWRSSPCYLQFARTTAMPRAPAERDGSNRASALGRALEPVASQPATSHSHTTESRDGRDGH